MSNKAQPSRAEFAKREADRLHERFLDLSENRKRAPDFEREAPYPTSVGDVQRYYSGMDRIRGSLRHGDEDGEYLLSKLPDVHSEAIRKHTSLEYILYESIRLAHTVANYTDRNAAERSESINALTRRLRRLRGYEEVGLAEPAETALPNNMDVNYLSFLRSIGLDTSQRWLADGGLQRLYKDVGRKGTGDTSELQYFAARYFTGIPDGTTVIERLMAIWMATRITPRDQGGDVNGLDRQTHHALWKQVQVLDAARRNRLDRGNDAIAADPTRRLNFDEDEVFDSMDEDKENAGDGSEEGGFGATTGRAPETSLARGPTDTQQAQVIPRVWRQWLETNCSEEVTRRYELDWTVYEGYWYMQGYTGDLKEAGTELLKESLNKSTPAQGVEMRVLDTLYRQRRYRQTLTLRVPGLMAEVAQAMAQLAEIQDTIRNRRLLLTEEQQQLAQGSTMITGLSDEVALAPATLTNTAPAVRALIASSFPAQVQDDLGLHRLLTDVLRHSAGQSRDEHVTEIRHLAGRYAANNNFPFPFFVYVLGLVANNQVSVIEPLAASVKEQREVLAQLKRRYAAARKEADEVRAALTWNGAGYPPTTRTETVMLPQRRGREEDEQSSLPRRSRSLQGAFNEASESQ